MKIEMRPAFQKGRKKCQKRHWNVELLDAILKSFVDKGGFSAEETIRYHDHSLKGKWKGHREFHPYGRRHDWVVIYHLEGNKIILDNIGSETTLVLDATGSHDEIFGSADQ